MPESAKNRYGDQMPMCLSETPKQRKHCWTFCGHYRNSIKIKQNFKAVIYHEESLN